MGSSPWTLEGRSLTLEQPATTEASFGEDSRRDHVVQARGSVDAFPLDHNQLAFNLKADAGNLIAVHGNCVLQP